MHILFFIKGVFLLLFLIGTSSAVLSRGVIFIHFLIILLIIFIYNIYNYIYLNPFTYFFYCLIVLLQVYWYLHGHHQYLHQNSYHNGIFQQSQKKIIELWFFLCSIIEAAWSTDLYLSKQLTETDGRIDSLYSFISVIFYQENYHRRFQFTLYVVWFNYFYWFKFWFSFVSNSLLYITISQNKGNGYLKQGQNWTTT